LRTCPFDNPYRSTVLGCSFLFHKRAGPTPPGSNLSKRPFFLSISLLTRPPFNPLSPLPSHRPPLLTFSSSPSFPHVLLFPSSLLLPFLFSSPLFSLRYSSPHSASGLRGSLPYLSPHPVHPPPVALRLFPPPSHRISPAPPTASPSLLLRLILLP